MPNDDCELTQGVTYEELPETEFSRHVDSVKHGWVRLQPYNQVKHIMTSSQVRLFRLSSFCQ